MWLAPSPGDIFITYLRPCAMSPAYHLVVVQCDPGFDRTASALICSAQPRLELALRFHSGRKRFNSILRLWGETKEQITLFAPDPSRPDFLSDADWTSTLATP